MDVNITPAHDCAQPAQTADLLRLDRFWRHDTIFNLVFASSDDLALRQALIERLSESAPARCMAIEVSTDLSPVDLNGLAGGHQAGAGHFP